MNTALHYVLVLLYYVSVLVLLVIGIDRTQ